jgi:hypothetical protein
VADPTPTQPPAPAPPPPPTARKPPPNRRRPPTAVEAFFRTGFGCVSALVFKLAVVVIIVLIIDWRSREKEAKREAERAATSESAARLADEFAKDTDPAGRFVRKREGPLEESDLWGCPFRLEYKPGTLSDGLEVRSAGPDGEWGTRDDVVVARSSKISNKALARDAAGGLLDAAKNRLLGKKPKDEKNEKK